MTQIELVGRESEISTLNACAKSAQSEFAVVFGRRRIGKTFLVNQTFKGKFDFCYVGGHHLNEREQLKNFSEALKSYSKALFAPTLEDWFDAFRQLQVYLESLNKSKKKIIFIDEMPWIDTPYSGFVKALENFWNGWAAMRNDIFLVASGSATSWMAEKLFENQGGLYNRITAQIYLRPFTLHEVELYLKSKNCLWDRFQIAQAYMIFGGVPFYYSLVNPKLSLAQNVDELFFAKNGRLRREFDELYNVLFSQGDKYIAVAKLLAGKPQGLCRDEIIKGIGIQGGAITKMLANLEHSDFIQSYASFGNKKKGTIYKLTDFFSLFYFKFLENNRSGDVRFWSNSLNTPAINSWQGISFERLCLLHTEQIKKKLGITGIRTEMSTWKNKTSQIDLIIDRADRIINLFEIKFSINKYSIAAKYAEKLRNRISEFQSSSKTRKGILHTFITTFGVLNAEGSSLVNSEIVLDDLFEK